MTAVSGSSRKASISPPNRPCAPGRFWKRALGWWPLPWSCCFRVWCNLNLRPLILDAHLDLAMNALEWNRDLTRPVAELRARELGKTDKPDRARGTVSLPEMRRGGVGICVATLIARIEHNAYSPVFGWRSPAQAYAQTQGQLAWYRAMEEAGEMVKIHDVEGLDKHLTLWNSSDTAEKTPVACVLSLEGADSILSPDHLARAYQKWLRAIGPAHYGPGIYANATG